MIIIGAGLAGAIARGFFYSYNPQVYEARNEPGSLHKAILRFRDPSIGLLLGVPMEEISVSKYIYFKGEFKEENPLLSNLYSKKVAQGIYHRSIEAKDDVKRFIAKKDFGIIHANYGKALTKVEPHKCYFSDGSCAEYEICISTIPLPVMAKAANIDIEKTTIKSSMISVARIRMQTKCNVYQTIYFPDPALNIYRATLEPDTLIIEAIGDDFSNKEIDLVLEAFGLEDEDLGKTDLFKQDMGKIVDMDDTVRRSIILELTEKFGIYSLGRYATWRNITSDALLNDLKIIAKMLEFNGKYQTRLENAR